MSPVYVPSGGVTIHGHGGPLHVNIHSPAPGSTRPPHTWACGARTGRRLMQSSSEDKLAVPQVRAGKIEFVTNISYCTEATSL